MVAWMLPQRFRQWIDLMATPLDRRSRKYWLQLIMGLLFVQGRRTASRWFVVAGVTDDWQDHYYFLGSLGRKTKPVATELLKIAIRQTPQLAR